MPTTQQAERSNDNNKCTFEYWAVRALVIGVLACIITLGIIERDVIINAIESIVVWIRDNPVIGTIVIVLIHIIAILIMFPGTMMSVICGYTFHQVFNDSLSYIPLQSMVFGTSCSLAGSQFGSLIALLIGRYLLRDMLFPIIHKHRILIALDNALRNKGAKIIFLFRCTPIMPFNVMNYGMGATSVSFTDFFIGGFGAIPEMILLVYIGTALSDIKNATSNEFEGGSTFIIILIAGLILGTCSVIYVSYLAKQELDRAVEEEKELLQSN